MDLMQFSYFISYFLFNGTYYKREEQRTENAMNYKTVHLWISVSMTLSLFRWLVVLGLTAL